MQQWASLLSGHSYDIKYCKADLHGNEDALSRLPLPATRPEPRTIHIFYFTQVEDAPVFATQVRRATGSDPVLAEVMDMVNPAATSPVFSRRTELSVQSGCLLWGRRVIIPLSLRNPILQHLHAGRSGIVRMKEMAGSYFWSARSR